MMQWREYANVACWCLQQDSHQTLTLVTILAALVAECNSMLNVPELLLTMLCKARLTLLLLSCLDIHVMYMFLLT